MFRIKEAIVVEGIYDKTKLSSIVDTLIITTHGFAIFKDQKQVLFLREIAQNRGLIILTDSDRAGFLIRNYIRQGIDPKNIKHAYIPDVFGKEKRKRQSGKEGKLGVEGIDAGMIERSLRNAGATFLDECFSKSEPESCTKRPITKLDFFNDGLSGSAQSARRRRVLAEKLSLPARLSANMLLDALNSLITYDEYCELVASLPL